MTEQHEEIDVTRVDAQVDALVTEAEDWTPPAGGGPAGKAR